MTKEPFFNSLMATCSLLETAISMEPWAGWGVLNTLYSRKVGACPAVDQPHKNPIRKTLRRGPGKTGPGRKMAFFGGRGG
jgi:hypothetical protein